VSHIISVAHIKSFLRLNNPFKARSGPGAISRVKQLKKSKIPTIFKNSFFHSL
jgi:hypothetical protein